MKKLLFSILIVMMAEGVAELPQKSKQKPQLSQVEAFLCP